MEELFIVSESGNIPISTDIIEKYSIRKGTKTPFSDRLIVDKFGDGTIEHNEEKTLSQPERNSQVFTTAESIDIAQGADS